MGAWRIRPKWVPQGTSHKCWAAAIAGWSRYNPQTVLGRTDRESVIQFFKDHGAHVAPTGAIRGEDLKILTDTVGLQIDRVRGGGTLTKEYLGPKLKTSHVLVVFRRPTATVLHTVLVYGVDNLYVCYMDPAMPNEESGHQCRRIYNFGDGADDFAIFWQS